MRRVLGGGLACGFAAATVVALAAPGGAQPSEPSFVVLEATVSPEVATPGGQVTITPDEPCTLEGEGPGSLAWFWLLDAEVAEPVQGEHFDEGEAPLNEDGTWEVSFPASSLNGEYIFSGFCLPNGIDGLDEEIAFCFPEEEAGPLAATEDTVEEPPVEEPPFDCLFEEYEEFFSVQGGTTPPTVPPGTGTPPPVAPPAVPVEGEPAFTG